MGERCLTPTAGLLCKLGSIVIHAEEFMGKGSHHFDLEVMKVLLEDNDVVTWLLEMRKLALIPEKREAT